MRNYLIIATLFFTIGVVNGQTEFMKGFDPKYSIKELAMDNWTTKNGLISNNVNSVFQASDDFLWIMSYNGLYRFDGYRFMFYDKSNLDFLISSGVNMAAEGEDGNIIFCTQSDGLFRYDGLNFHALSINQDIPNAIISIFIDSNENLWIGSKNNGLFKMSSSGEVTKENQIPNLTVNNIAEDLLGNIWVSTVGQGVFKIKPDGVENFSSKSGLAGDITTTLTVDNENIMYVGSVDGLNTIKDTRVSSIPDMDGIIINDIVIDDYGTKWIGSDRGLIRYPSNGQPIEFFNEEDGLPGNRVISLFFDNEGSLWVGMYETGLVRFKSSVISNLTSQNGLSNNRIYSIDKHNGDHFVGTQDGNINVYNEGGITQLDLPEQFKEDAIRDFLFEKDTIWAGNYMGIVKISPDNRRYFNKENILPNIGVRRMFKSANGTKWLATRSGGLIKFRENGNHEVFDKSNGLLTNYVMAINEDQDGNILIGTNAGGLSVLSKDGVLANYQLSGDDSGTIIFNIRIEQDNRIWLCTNLGLYLFEDGSFSKVEFNARLKTDKVFDLIYDQVDSYWLTSGNGVIKVGIDQLEAFIQNEITEVPFAIYNEEDGMMSRECTGATQSYYDESTGKIWIPTYEGVAIIDPSRRIVNNKIPKVLITGLQVDNNDIRFENNLIIQPGTFRYIFDFTSLSFLAPSKVQFKYKLDGIEKQWNGPTNKRKIEYTGLPYGDYKLIVIASNNDNVWNNEGATLSFTVKPFFYETLWFRAIGAVLLIFLFYFLYRWRVRNIKKTNKQLKKMNQELDSFIYSASHDLRGPLTTSMGVLDLAMSPKAEKEKYQYFEMIKTNTDKMDHFIKELINYARNKNDEVDHKRIKIEPIIDEVIDELNSDEFGKKGMITKEIPTDMEMIGDARRLKVVIKNLLHNALVFSSGQPEKSEVKVNVFQRQGKTVLVVKDNGVGISEDIKSKIFNMFFRGNNLSKGSGLGLYVVKNTCEKLNATIDFRSSAGNGSEFIVTIP